MKKVQSLNRSLSELPYEVIWDILCRLPIKTCLSCKLVCKDWYNIIISPRFADLRRSYCSSRVTVMLKCRFPSGRYNFMLLELDKGSNNVDQMGNIRVGTDCMIKFKSKFGVPNGELYVVNVCNGLVCLKPYKKWACYYICNFLISRFVTVEQFQPRSHALYRSVLGSCPMPDNAAQYGSRLSGVWGDPNMGSLIPTSRETNSDGSYPMTLQYKVLRILQTRTREYVAEILTLGSDRWRQIHDAPKSRYNFQAFLNGSFHWCDNWHGKCNIWAFHFGTEKFLCIPAPDEFKVRRRVELTVFDSCLCFCCVCGGSSTESEVWLMKEYGVGHSWVRQLIIHVPLFGYSPYRPLMRMDNGQILIEKCGSFLALYDPETNAYKQVEIDGAFDIQKLQECDADFSWILGGVQGE